MSIKLPKPGPEAQNHPSSLTLEELCTPRYYRPFIGLVDWPPLPYEAWVDGLKAPNIEVIDRRPGNAERVSLSIPMLGSRY